jgi:hypothetical protein
MKRIDPSIRFLADSDGRARGSIPKARRGAKRGIDARGRPAQLTR